MAKTRSKIVKGKKTLPRTRAKKIPETNADKIMTKIAGDDALQRILDKGIVFLEALNNFTIGTVGEDEVQDSTEDLLRELKTFKIVLPPVPAVPAPIDPPKEVDPLTLPFNGRHLSIFADAREKYIRFDYVDRERATVQIDLQTGRAVLHWGCRRIRTEAEARRHWVDNVSTVSREQRLHATELMDRIVAICRFHKWTW
jgi:hypothetical protein